MAPYWRDSFASPSGIHVESKRVRDAIEKARNQVLSLLGVTETGGQIIFTGNGTEAVNLAVLGHARANRRFGTHILCSAIEHPAVLNAVVALEREGFSNGTIPVDAAGHLKFDTIGDLLTSDTILLCCHLANSDIGIIQSLARIGELTRSHGIALFVDATSAAGWTEVAVDAICADLMAISPHRFGGPKGVGCLFKRQPIVIDPLTYGGEQERGLRAGMENVPAIVGAGTVAEMAQRQLRQNRLVLGTLQKRLLDGLLDAVPRIRLNGPALGQDRLCHQLSLTIDCVEAEGLVLFADMRGLVIAMGGGCLSRALETHHVLTAVGLSQLQAKQTISLGIGLETTKADVDAATEILKAGVERLRSMSPSWSDEI